MPSLTEDQDDEDNQRDDVIQAFLAESGLPDPAAGVPDLEVARSIADLCYTYGDGYIARGVYAWSPDWVQLFQSDWLPRKSFLDDDERAALPEVLRRWLQFALARNGVGSEWIPPVIEAVDTYLPALTAALDDESAWGPAKQVATELVR